MTQIFPYSRIRSLWSARGVRLVAASVMVVGGVLAATSAMNAWAERGQGGEGPRTCMHGEGMRGAMGAGPMGPMALGGRGLDRLLDDVKATDAQRQQIHKIADAARLDLDKQQSAMRALHEQSIAVLTQPKLDPVAAEKLRQQMLSQHDAVSKRMLAAMLDVAKVLTPEQRAQVAQHIKTHQERRERWRERMDEGASGAAEPRR